MRVRLRVRNALPALNPLPGETFQSSTHLHGSASLPQFDGYANDVAQVGDYKTYEYPDYQGARTLWYHDHAVHRTAQNVYSGLAAQFHLHDQAERAQLPQGGRPPLRSPSRAGRRCPFLPGCRRHSVRPPRRDRSPPRHLRAQCGWHDRTSSTARHPPGPELPGGKTLTLPAQGR